MARNHKGYQRKKLKATQVQAMLATIQKRITGDGTLTADQLISLTNAAVALAQTLHRMDKAVLSELNKQRKADIFSKRGTDPVSE